MSNLYGRKVSLEIWCTPKKAKQRDVDVITVEQSGFDPETLRIVFDINYPGISGWYFSEISIYNLNKEDRNKVIEEGAIVTLSAGYVGDELNFGVIFKGYVFQTLVEREGVVDYKLTLRCLDGDRLFTDANICVATVTRGMNAVTAVNNILLPGTKREIPFDKQELTDYLKSHAPKTDEEVNTSAVTNKVPDNLPRGQTIFKSPAEVFKEMLPGARIFSFQSKAHVMDDDEVFNPDTANKIVVSPEKGGLIGTPVQTQYGCDFTILLNPNVILGRPHCVVQLDNQAFKQVKVEYMQLPSSGIEVTKEYQIQEYQVIGVRHQGDSRGDQWYTHITGMAMHGARPTEMFTYTGGNQR
jgi:hypothetical protein